MPDPSAIAALPGLLRAARLSVEEHAPTDGLAGFWRTSVATSLYGVELMAECLVAAMPVAASKPRAQQEQQTFYAPLGDRSPVVEAPRVPRRGPDLRLPGKRPHP